MAQGARAGRPSVTAALALRSSLFGTSHRAARTMNQRRHLSSYFVSPEELAGALGKTPRTKISTSPRTIPLCASWFLPNDPQQRTGLSVYKKQRIPSARFFDLDGIKDHDSPYPHMLPTAEQFADAMRQLGINVEDEIVVYDSAELGIFSAPRVGWTLKVFGHHKVHILNNFKLWVEQGYPTESGDAEEAQPSQYQVPMFDASKVAGFAEIREIASDYGKEGAEGVQILDARPRGRWAGIDPEPRPGLSSGHIPGSYSVPVSDLLDSTSKAFLPKEKLQKVFLDKGIDPEKPIISSCGTGVTAAVIDAALSEAEFGDDSQRRLYDGSWT
ncbi:MAG: hypothetical protein M1837_003279 [Sclerophora amabilis]|nr:MAG: hypothetical protein M1837_003279 [Sclerophora amabilis]